MPDNLLERVDVKEGDVSIAGREATESESLAKTLEQFNKDAINDETVELLYPYLAAVDFTPDDARKVAGALAGLCTWARAMALYVDIAKVVKPQQAQLKIALGKLAAANKKLDQAHAELSHLINVAEAADSAAASALPLSSLRLLPPMSSRGPAAAGPAVRAKEGGHRAWSQRGGCGVAWRRAVGDCREEGGGHAALCLLYTSDAADE
mgnify:CR=1 FL=1